MAILVLSYAPDGVFAKSTANVVSAAAQIGGDVTILLAGANLDSAAQQAASLQGVSKVLTAQSANLEHARSGQLADLVLSIAQDFDYILTAATALGKATLPRVAAKLDVAQISEIVKVVSPTQFERPIYAGNALETVETTQAKNVLTVRTTSFDAVGAGGSATIEALDTDIAAPAETFVSAQNEDAGRPKLDEASVVVSGGVSLGSQENFEKLIYPLADKLNAGVGASRAAVDSGFIANDAQVGQTGKIVAPELYIAVGISGAIQHVAGMRASKTIVAINNDAESPMMEMADYALEGDLFEIVPQLIEKL